MGNDGYLSSISVMISVNSSVHISVFKSRGMFDRGSVLLHTFMLCMWRRNSMHATMLLYTSCVLLTAVDHHRLAYQTAVHLRRAYSSTEAISSLLNMGQAAILTGGLTAVSVAAVLGGLGGTITAGNLVRRL